MNALVPPPTGQPALVAVIVDNHVVGDSRVQKCAVAAAEAGYRVVLVGRAPVVPDSFTIGGPGATAEVRRIEAPFRLLALSRRAPRGRWRYPLAYPSADHCARQSLQLAALAADLTARKIVVRRNALPGGPSRVSLAALYAETARWRARRTWHRARALSLRWMTDRVKASDSVGYRFGTRLRSLLRGRRAWRALDPVLLDVELSFGPELDALAPDLIHANDFRMSGVAVRAAARAAAQGRRVPVVYDVHESVAGVVSKSLRWRTANVGHEAEYIRQVDEVVTVGDRLARMLQEGYRLPRLPRVVLNAPTFEPDAVPLFGGVRSACGLGPDLPLLVYCGSTAPQRGLATAVDGLAHLPGVHLALVVANPMAEERLVERAEHLGVADRLHLLGYVPHDEVVPFLRSATAGVIPIHHVPNHEIALITKYFEYAYAGLPIVTSDTETMGGRTRDLGNGEVFAAEDVGDYVRAVRAVLADPQRYRAAYGQHPDVLRAWSWETQKTVLLQVYADALRSVAQPVGVG